MREPLFEPHPGEILWASTSFESQSTTTTAGTSRAGPPGPQDATDTSRNAMLDTQSGTSGAVSAGGLQRGMGCLSAGSGDRRLPGQSDVLLGCSVLEHWCDLRGSRGGSRFAGDRGGGWSTGCCRPADGLWVLHLRRPLAGAGRRNVVDDSLVETDDETRVRRLSGRVGGLSCWVRLRTGRVGRSSIGGDGGGVGRVLW